jgi:hypothetical protein
MESDQPLHLRTDVVERSRLDMLEKDPQVSTTMFFVDSIVHKINLVPLHLGRDGEDQILRYVSSCLSTHRTGTAPSTPILYV